MDREIVAIAYQMLTTEQSSSNPLPTRTCGQCGRVVASSSRSTVMIEMQPGRYAPHGQDPRDPWWLCTHCYRYGLKAPKIADDKGDTVKASAPAAGR